MHGTCMGYVQTWNNDAQNMHIVPHKQEQPCMYHAYTRLQLCHIHSYSLALLHVAVPMGYVPLAN